MPFESLKLILSRQITLTWLALTFWRFLSLVFFNSRSPLSSHQPSPPTSFWTIDSPSPAGWPFWTISQQPPVIACFGIWFIITVFTVPQPAKSTTGSTASTLRCILSSESHPTMKRLWSFVRGWFSRTFLSVTLSPEWCLDTDRGQLWCRWAKFRSHYVFI